ncbi:MAG: tyrosine-type recombinase/integrase [Zoogloea oleivorans]|nr:tyrosine-type recombinase/integrase [Zoogloea oleivorans]
MSLLTKVIGHTVGKVVPRFRTIAQWLPTYNEIVARRDIGDKTRSNRRVYARLLSEAFSERAIGSLRPHEVSAVITKIAQRHPHLAKRVLVEARDMFNEALLAGWIDLNPAEAVKTPIVKILRRRLSMDQWQRIHDYADCCSPPWVALMMTLAVVTGQRRGDIRKMRFSDVWAEPDGQLYLHIEQQKTGKRLAIPLALRLDAIDVSVGEAIDRCRKYAVLDSDGDGYMIRKTTGGMLAATSMSWRFEEAREGALPPHSGKGTPPSLHECRSLAERTYREQGINTMVLLGHSQQSMTDLYNRDRGLDAQSQKWKTLTLVPRSA